MAIKISITVDLTCDRPHPWDNPVINVPPDIDVMLYIKDWMLRHGWSLDESKSGDPRMLCPACTYDRLCSEGYDGVFLEAPKRSV